MELVDVFLQVARLVQLGLQGNGVHEDFPSHPFTEHLLDLAQVGGCGRAVPAAAGVHHVEHYHLAAYQVFIELNLPALMSE
ncbi:hypothetical protein D3C84_1046570 [compost metagenome]